MKTLIELPLEVLLYIFPSLGVRDLIRLEMTCKLLHAATYDYQTWLGYVQRIHQCHPELDPHYSLDGLDTAQLKARAIHYTQVQARWRQTNSGNQNPIPGKVFHLPPGILSVFMLPGGEHLLFILGNRASLVAISTEDDTFRLHQLAELQFDPANASDISLSLKYNVDIYNSKGGLIVVSRYKLGTISFLRACCSPPSIALTDMYCEDNLISVTGYGETLAVLVDRWNDANHNLDVHLIITSIRNPEICLKMNLPEFSGSPALSFRERITEQMLHCMPADSTLILCDSKTLRLFHLPDMDGSYPTGVTFLPDLFSVRSYVPRPGRGWCAHITGALAWSSDSPPVLYVGISSWEGGFHEINELYSAKFRRTVHQSRLDLDEGHGLVPLPFEASEGVMGRMLFLTHPETNGSMLTLYCCSWDGFIRPISLDLSYGIREHVWELEEVSGKIFATKGDHYCEKLVIHDIV